MERHTCTGYEHHYQARASYIVNNNDRKRYGEYGYLFNKNQNFGGQNQNVINLVKAQQNNGSYTSRPSMRNSRSRSSNFALANQIDKPLFRLSRNLPNHARKRSYNLRSRSRGNHPAHHRKGSLNDLYFHNDKLRRKSKPPQPARKDDKASLQINLNIQVNENKENSRQQAQVEVLPKQRGKDRQFKINNLAKDRVQRRYLCSPSPKPSSPGFNNFYKVRSPDRNMSVVNDFSLHGQNEKAMNGRMKIEMAESNKENMQAFENEVNHQMISDLDLFECPMREEKRGLLSEKDANRLAGMILNDPLAEFVYCQVASKNCKHVVRKLFGSGDRKRGVLSCRDAQWVC